MVAKSHPSSTLHSCGTPNGLPQRACSPPESDWRDRVIAPQLGGREVHFQTSPSVCWIAPLLQASAKRPHMTAPPDPPRALREPVILVMRAVQPQPGHHAYCSAGGQQWTGRVRRGRAGPRGTAGRAPGRAPSMCTAIYWIVSFRFRGGMGRAGRGRSDEGRVYTARWSGARRQLYACGIKQRSKGTCFKWWGVSKRSAAPLTHRGGAALGAECTFARQNLPKCRSCCSCPHSPSGQGRRLMQIRGGSISTWDPGTERGSTVTPLIFGVDFLRRAERPIVFTLTWVVQA